MPSARLRALPLMTFGRDSPGGRVLFSADCVRDGCRLLLLRPRLAACAADA
jgi:hypothetical protein